jgi:hypothetical protein
MDKSVLTQNATNLEFTGVCVCVWGGGVSLFTHRAHQCDLGVINGNNASGPPFGQLELRCM